MLSLQGCYPALTDGRWPRSAGDGPDEGVCPGGQCGMKSTHPVRLGCIGSVVTAIGGGVEGGLCIGTSAYCPLI
jgi:hypothetical protein